MSIYAKGPKGKADRLFSQVVRLLGHCQRCGKTSDLQCAHIIRREYNNTRTDLRNAWCLCAGCHIWLGNHPFDHVVYAYPTIGEETYAELREIAHTSRKWKEADWEAECVRLQALLEEAA